jgi:Lrp/AsnC family leucine-responsive transcriptional regulator
VLDDETDRVIVRALAADGRMSFTDLARQSGLSVSAVHARVRKLEQRGVIAGYSAVIDPVAVGLPITAFVSITPIDPAAPDDAPERLAGDGVAALDGGQSGEESYILKVRVPAPTDLEQLLADIRSAANVRTRTTIVLSTPWEGRPPGL